MKQFGKHSNTFYRLAKKDGRYREWIIYDFHTSHPAHHIGEPYYWIESFEICENMNQNGEIIGGKCGIKKEKNVQREDGNALYMKLKNDGFIVVGKFEQDICGNERRI